MYKVGTKLYIPFEWEMNESGVPVSRSSIHVYNISNLSLIKKIERDKEYIPPLGPNVGLHYNLIYGRGVVDGNYLYI